MASLFSTLCIDCRDPHALAGFWGEVLGYPIDEATEDDVNLKAPQGRGPDLLFQKVPEGKSVKNRLHIDVNPVDRDQDEEVERVIGLGATKVDIGQGDVSWVVLADPEGNEFCVLRTRIEV